MRLRKMLKRMDAQWVFRVRSKIEASGIKLPLSNAEIKHVCQNKTERKKLNKAIQRELS